MITANNHDCPERMMTKRRSGRPSAPNGWNMPDRGPAGALLVPQPGTVRWIACLALFLMMVGARWWMIGNYGSDVPWLDQWDGPAQGIFKPYHDGTLTAESWFGPHNEHRILFTRILVLGLQLLNGQWDPRLEMVVNAVLYAIVACGLLLVLSQDRSRRFILFLAAVLSAIFTFPYGSTNTLLGFQSQFYFLAGFSFVAMYTLLNSRTGSLSWFGGVLSGGAALFSMGSGFTAPLIVLAVFILLAIRSRGGWRLSLQERWITIAAASILIAAGFYLRVSPESHIPLRAHSMGEFAKFLLACLSWPGKSMTIVAVVSWLPFAVFFADFVSGRVKDGPRERFVLGMGFWVLLQAAALAFYRGHSAEGLESRYMDILSFGLIANVMCAAWLINGSKRGRFMLMLTIIWLTVNGLGLYAVSFKGTLFGWKQVMEFRRAQTAGFVASEDPQFLNSRWVPHYDPKRLGSLLLDPAIYPILPFGIRKSLRLVPSLDSPEPLFSSVLSIPDPKVMKPDLWNWTGIYSRFAVIRSPSLFEYHVVKKTGLPYLFLYFSGSKENFSVFDSQRIEHTIRLFPGDDDRSLHPAFVSCPTETCRITGSADRSEIVFMEPKEIGFLSIGALVASLGGPVIFGLGITFFVVLLILSLAKISRVFDKRKNNLEL